ncbi:MAG: phosphotransferase, partial [Alphaproteobacteria bacterium]
LSSAQALLHGDLHTGSVMVTNDQTRIIDPEFAFVGPMGFDIGAVIGNLLINYFSHAGYEKNPGERDAYRAWVLQTVGEVWTLFEAKFLALWRSGAGAGDAYPAALFDDEKSAARLEAERQVFMGRLLQETLGFAAAKMIRRVLGLAHNADLENIADPDRRAPCEMRVLRLARALMVDTPSFTSIEAVTTAAAMYNTTDI